MAKQAQIKELISLIFTVSQHIRERARKSQHFNPISFLRLETIRYISEHKSPSMNDVSRHLCISLPSTTSLINQIVKMGHIKRMGDKTDRRIVRLAITKKGKKMLELRFKRLSRRMKETLSCLDQEDIENLIRTLKKLSRKLPN